MSPYDYPLSDPTSIVVVRKARKDYRCSGDWAHDRRIHAGEIYARIKITPGLGYGWREDMMHAGCLDPAKYDEATADQAVAE